MRETIERTMGKDTFIYRGLVDVANKDILLNDTQIAFRIVCRCLHCGRELVVERTVNQSVVDLIQIVLS